MSGESTSIGFGDSKCGKGVLRKPAYPALTLAQAKRICCEKGWAGFNFKPRRQRSMNHDPGLVVAAAAAGTVASELAAPVVGDGCFIFIPASHGATTPTKGGFSAYKNTAWVPPPPPPPLSPTRRKAPPWPYNWSKFPAVWFGANWSGYENPSQMDLLGNFSMVLFGWQHMQLYCNYTDLLEAQIAQTRRVKSRYPEIPVFVYLPIVDAQPYYATERPLFGSMTTTSPSSSSSSSSNGRFQRAVGSPDYTAVADDDLSGGSSSGAEELRHREGGLADYPLPAPVYRDFFFLDQNGSLSPLTTHTKCAPGHIVPKCTCSQWNFFNASARAYYLNTVVSGIARADPHNEAFDGIFYDAAAAFLRRTWEGAANAPSNATDDEVMHIEIAILNATVALSNAHNKYPAYNIHLRDASVASGREQRIMDPLGGQGMFRFYEGSSTLDRDWIENALQERSIQLYTVVGVGAPRVESELLGLIAGFLLVRSTHYYFSAHNGYLDNGFKWHKAYDVDYGMPLDDPVATPDGTGAVIYTREYTRCKINVICGANETRCRGWVNMTAEIR